MARSAQRQADLERVIVSELVNQGPGPVNNTTYGKIIGLSNLLGEEFEDTFQRMSAQAMEAWTSDIPRLSFIDTEEHGRVITQASLLAAVEDLLRFHQGATEGRKRALLVQFRQSIEEG
jgi:hypothetical protein